MTDDLRRLDGAMVQAAMQGGYVAEIPADLIAERLLAALAARSEPLVTGVHDGGTFVYGDRSEPREAMTDVPGHGDTQYLAGSEPRAEGLREALERVTAMLEEECYPLAEDPANGIEYNEGICAERGRIAGILDSLLSPEAEGLKPHPGSPHEFVTRCMACGENGFLNVSVLTHNERVTISEGEW
jgi:hypothetical protein